MRNDGLTLSVCNRPGCIRIQPQGYPCKRGHSQGLPIEILIQIRTTVPYCSNCGKQLEDGWVNCPYCVQTENVIPIQVVQHLPWYGAVFNYLIGTASIFLGIFLQLLVAKANYNSQFPNVLCTSEGCTDYTSVCIGFQILFLVFGIYLIVGTAHKRKYLN